MGLLQVTLEQYKEQLRGDSVVNSHLSILYDTLLQQNLYRLIEPFSRVEISHSVKLIELEPTVVEKKLSQVRARRLGGSSFEQKNVLDVDDSGQDDHGDVGSGFEDSCRRHVDRKPNFEHMSMLSSCHPPRKSDDKRSFNYLSNDSRLVSPRQNTLSFHRKGNCCIVRVSSYVVCRSYAVSV